LSGGILMPDPTLLDRSASLGTAEPLLQVVNPLLVEAIDYGCTSVFPKLLKVVRAEEVPDERLPITFSYRLMLEMLDGVQVLLAAAAPEPAALQLRTILETSLGIRYILKEDSQRRALAWVVSDIHRRIRFHEQFDPSTPRGAEYQGVLSKDELVHRTKMRKHDSKEPVFKLRRLLEKPHLHEVAAEYERCRKRWKGHPRWFSLFDGPANLDGLAERLQRGGMYGLLYRHWSAMSHGEDLYRQLRPPMGEGLTIQIIRDPSMIRTMASYGISFFMDASHAIVNFYLPEMLPEWKAWYQDRIRKGCQVLDGREFD